MCRQSHLDSYSAASAFFLFVSIIPFCLLFLSIIPYTPISDKDLYTILKVVLPSEIDNYITGIVRQISTESITLVSVSAVTLLWTASRGILSIKNGLNEIHNKSEDRNFILLRINASIHMVILIASIFAIIFLHIIATAVDRYFRAILHIDISQSSNFFSVVLTFRPLITIVIAFLANLYFFTMLPNDRCRMKEQIPGAVLVSVAWYVLSAFFSLYIEHFNAYSMYGPLTVIIMALFWLYACLFILFIGAEFNYYLITRRNRVKA